MKRVYRNNDITFNLTVNCFPFKPELIDRIDFKFYTMNKNNFISKTKADIVNDTLILEWSELSKLEQGVLNYSYDVGQKDPKYGDNYLNQGSDVITDYFIMSGKDGIDVPSNATKWGDITGDVNNQQDLVSLIDLKIKGINIGEYAKKTDIPTKVSQLENDSKYLIEKDIAGKVDNTTYTKEKQEFLAIVGKKADKTEIPTKVSELINDSNFTTDSKVAVNHYTKDEINNVQKTLATKDEISDMATKTWTNQQNYLKEVPSEYITESELISKDYATKTDVSKKLDISTYNKDKSTFATKTDLEGKQNTLVSGDNIKTINNQNILGSGNITIEGGGGAPKGGYMRALYEAAGAMYNEGTGFYELNGLTDITEEQMAVIYAEFGSFRPILGSVYSKAYNYQKSRTNINLNPGINYVDSTAYKDKAIDIGECFTGSTKLEVLLLAKADYESQAIPLGTSGYQLFGECKNLRKIIGNLGVANLTGMIRPFVGCKALEYVHITHVHFNMDFNDCPNLDVSDTKKGTLSWLIRLSSNFVNGKDETGGFSKITVSLHPDAFARVPQGIKDKATARNISLVSA